MIVTLLVTTIKLTRSKIKTIVSAFIPAALWDPNIVSEEEIINHVPWAPSDGFHSGPMQINSSQRGGWECTKVPKQTEEPIYHFPQAHVLALDSSESWSVWVDGRWLTLAGLPWRNCAWSLLHWSAGIKSHLCLDNLTSFDFKPYLGFFKGIIISGLSRENRPERIDGLLLFPLSYITGLKCVPLWTKFLDKSSGAKV